MPTAIAYVEDNAVNRKTFISKINHFPDLSLVLTGENGNDFLLQMKGLPLEKHPSVVFMDIEMPEMDGIQAIRIGKALYSHIHFVVLTVFDNEEKIFEAIRAGATGYLLKNEKAEAIRKAIENVLVDGGIPMSPAIARKAMEMLVKTGPSTAGQAGTKPVDNSGTMLSGREMEILEYTIKGWDAKRIASFLNLSVHTVRKHIANIYTRLHVNSKAQVIHLAHELKWFQ
ncbi:response regulator transcription factor [Flavisolibacter nicotianae]|uniref:response regulator transcription factor n=1 Tax=Flavisolibacter nicotianae TaxID=2364882 RepID=UPI000EAB968F|nr:response regulator transcription factor [Flavisolibacter nicotianae]